VPSDERVVRPAFLGGIEASSEVQVYYLALIVLALALLGMRGVRSGRFGRALVALRDNERAAQAYAVDAARTQLAAFALSGAIAAMAGGLFVHHEQAFDGTSYSPIENLAVFTMVVVGGMGSLAGAVLGALFLLGGRWFLDTNWQFVVSGLGVLAILLVAPSGLAGLVYRARDAWLRTVARSRDLDVPGYSSTTTGPDTPPTARSAAGAGMRGADALAGPSPSIGGAEDHTRAGGNGDGPTDAPTTGLAHSADPTSPAATPPAVASPFDVGAGDRGVGPSDSASRAAGLSAGEEPLRSGAGAGGVSPSDSGSLTAESRAAEEPLGAGAGAGGVGPPDSASPAAEPSSGGVKPLGARAGSTGEGSADSGPAVAHASAMETEASGEAAGAGEWLLDVQRVEAGYSGVPVLFGVDLAVRAGEAVALLGTNGAGKSTLLNAISGLTPPTAGRVLVGGDDLTGRPAHVVAAQGVAQMPGGKGTFPTLTVAENLRVAGWLRRGDRSGLATDLERLQALFPVLLERSGQLAGSLSGGQQQMLALAMSVLTRPRLLMIDELSLGLAPVVVADLLRFVAELRADGTTLVIVEQSVNVALEVADRAVFLERGEVRFTGPASDLLDRPDLLRSVFLGAVTPAGAPSTAIPSTPTPTPGRPSEAPAMPDAAATLGSPPGPHATTGAPADDAPGGEPAASTAPAPAAGPAGRATGAAPAGPVLEVHGVSVAFGGVHAVEDVSFDVAPGEVVGVIGPNGAGKTTLFDLLSGFIPPSTGRVVLAGRDVTGLNASDRARKGLGRSFQDARLFASMTVEESIAVALERWTRAGDPLSAAFHLPNAVDDEHRVRRRVDQLIGLLGLEGFRSLFVGELSTGTRRVVDLACLLAHRPRVVLLDEPASGIAQREVEQLAPLIRRIRDETGASLVVVEHDIPLVEQVADRIVAMDQGRVVAVGPPAAVLSDPAVLRSYVGDDHAAIRRSGTRATARPHAETRG
jgi:ABC-type branched-subunit amino acid transport system ATPase component